MSAWGEKNTRGMTLMELLVVIVVIGVLIGLLIPATANMRIRAVHTKARAARAALRTAILSYHAEYDKWPVDDQFNKKTYKSKDIIPRLRDNAKHFLFWEGADSITSAKGTEYSVIINPNGMYPIITWEVPAEEYANAEYPLDDNDSHPKADFNSSYQVSFSAD